MVAPLPGVLIIVPPSGFPVSGRDLRAGPDAPSSRRSLVTVLEISWAVWAWGSRFMNCAATIQRLVTILCKASPGASEATATFESPAREAEAPLGDAARFRHVVRGSGSFQGESPAFRLGRRVPAARRQGRLASASCGAAAALPVGGWGW